MWTLLLFFIFRTEVLDQAEDKPCGKMIVGVARKIWTKCLEIRNMIEIKL